MKTYITLLIVLLMTNYVISQQEQEIHKIVADEFEINYNSDNYDAIFASFSLEMQKSLPFEKTKEFLVGLKKQAGNIKKREFVKYLETFASYKTTFERVIFTMNISVDENLKINGLFFKPYSETVLPSMERNKTKLILPFKDEWTIIWGGDTKELNYHVDSEAQKNAFDIVIVNEMGNSYKTDGKTNEDYYAFGKELIAPCAGEVVLVVDGIKDNIPGTLNPIYVPGNTVIIKTANNEYLFFAHFKQHSIVVKQGQKVKQGQLLGLCGNSGNSTEAHVHFHIQNVEDMNVASGVKCYFDEIVVDGEVKTDYSPIQGEKISNEK